MKRIMLFLATNIAVILILSIAMRLLGADQYMAQQGYNYQALLVFSAIFGMGGAFISLSLSKWLAKRSTGARVIEKPAGETEAWLLRTVEHQARQAGIGMPEVAIFPSPQPNAFATGAKRDAALVAVSEGLLQQMSRDEVEAVLAHEISHIANGDMVTLTLIQGVLNTFVIFLSRIIGGIVNRVVFRSNSNYGITGQGGRRCQGPVGGGRHRWRPLAELSARGVARDGEGQGQQDHRYSKKAARQRRGAAGRSRGHRTATKADPIVRRAPHDPGIP